MEENNNVETNENLGKVENSTVEQQEQETYQQSQPANQQTNYTANGKSINTCGLISFIFAMIGILVYAFPCGIIATILGIVGLATFKPEKQTAKWMAVTGLVVGAVDAVFGILAIYIALM